MGGRGTAWPPALLVLAGLAAVGWQLAQPSLTTPDVRAACVALGVAAIVGGVVARRRVRRARWLALPAFAVGIALVAFASTDMRAASRLADALPVALEGRDLDVTGVVASLPQVGDAGVRFRFALDPASRERPEGRLPETIALGWYAGFHDEAASSEPQRSLKAGQRWRFTVRLKRPHGSLNPHGFDLELWLFERGVRATGYVRGAGGLVDDDGGVGIDRWRQSVRDAIVARVADPRAAGVLAALAIGDQGAIDRDDWALFRDTGVAHLMSISGLHVTMFAWGLGLAIGVLWRRLPRAMLALPAPQAARWGGLAAAAGYALLSGWGVPAQRTVWMLATVTLLRAAGVRWPWALVLLVAAAVVTLIDPWALLQPGFWLSFAAVGLLLASSPREAVRDALDDPTGPWWRRWSTRGGGVAREALRTQVVATLGLAPLTLVFFQQLSPVGFVANLVAIPLVTLLVTPLALFGIAFAPLWSLGAWLVQSLSDVLARLVAWPGATVVVPAAPLWAVLAGLLGALVVVLPLPWRLRAMGLPLVLALVVPPRTPPADGAFELVAIDVGQGSAILVRTRAHALLFDTGPQYARTSDAGERIVVPLLRALGAPALDRLVLSHRDADHTGGARAVLGSLDVRLLTSSLEPFHPLQTLAPATEACAAGQRWTWDGVAFTVLWPPADDPTLPVKPNARSCVVRIDGGGRSALLTGDLEREQEARLVAAHGAALASDVLFVPHHGSATSSSAAFLDTVRPRVAVVQAGYRNRFGHPAADVVARYRERAIPLVASAACGAWRWSSGDEASAGRCHRETARRYWHHPGR